MTQTQGLHAQAHLCKASSTESHLIKCLPQLFYGSQEKMEQEECAICMLDFVCGDPIRSLPCKHFYHLGCIDEWLIRSFTCPCCRRPADGPKPSS
uniref:RING-type domain-containing protein n=1 Tax=Catagonus wagneri TaxID=51154 RepID=A0A8C3YGL3_9CETA